MQKNENSRASLEGCAPWEENVRRVIPYTPGEQPKQTNVIKLNTNENPYPPSPGVREVLAAMDTDMLRKYPDPTCGSLVNALAAQYHVKPEQVFTGVGSDDVIANAFLAFFNSDKPILFADVTYTFYDTWAQLFRIPYEIKPLDETFSIRPEDYETENGGIIIANPNAPTGKLLPLSDIERIVRSNPGSVVMVDEAYIDFGGESALSLIDRYSNLLVIRTFSKSRSLAGMRIGYAFGCEKLIRYLQDVKYSYNSYTMNTPSLLAGCAAVRDEAYYRETAGRIIATRERVKPLFRELGFSFCDSMTNFLFVRHADCPAEELFAALRAEGIFVRHWNRPRISDYLRITIGTDEEMDTLLAFLEDYLRKR